jgi:hypothetical protein
MITSASETLAAEDSNCHHRVTTLRGTEKKKHLGGDNVCLLVCDEVSATKPSGFHEIRHGFFTELSCKK